MLDPGMESRMVKLASTSSSAHHLPIILEMLEVPFQEVKRQHLRRGSRLATQRDGVHTEGVLASSDGAVIVLDATQNTSLQAISELAG